LEQEFERILTPSQARFELLELRNEIRHSYQKSGRNLEHWENILQGPIVDQMLSERPSDVIEWKSLPAVAAKYSQFTELMDEQLSAFSERMFEILSRITSINFFEDFDEDIPF
jgi:hypothetical protein